MERNLTADQFRSNIITFFEEGTGMKTPIAQDLIRKQLIIDKWGNTHNESMKFANVRLFYCANRNYAGGAKNGYGKGWYISNGGFTGGSTIKLSDNL